VTWHGPGQIVGYPVLNLNNYTPSVRWYVHALEDVLVRTLSSFGLESHTTSDVGVWIDGQRKIAAIGIAVSRWVTTHGTSTHMHACIRSSALI
jgi:lipoate-protein ligase B